MIVFKGNNVYEIAALFADCCRKLSVPLRTLIWTIARCRHQQQGVALQCTCL
jgi:hypothetical protein